MDVSDSDRLRRLFRAAGVTAGLLGLAGCGDTADLDPGQDHTEVGGGGTPGSTATAGHPTGTPGPSAADLGCETGGADAGEIRNRIDQLEYELSFVREEWAEKFGRRGQLPGGFEDDTLEAAREVGTRVRESVVLLELPSGQATGWYIDDHHVMTNAHNVFGHDSATAWTVDGSSFGVDVIDLVEEMLPDVALLRADSAGTPLPLGSASAMEPGDTVVQVGHPGEVGNWLVTVGRHITTVGVGEPADGSSEGPGEFSEVRTSVPGAQGNSGSPLVNLDGEVVAMTHGGTDQNPLPHDGPPEPSEPVVHDWPLRWKMWSLHVPVETVLERYEDWR